MKRRVAVVGILLAVIVVLAILWPIGSRTEPPVAAKPPGPVGDAPLPPTPAEPVTTVSSTATDDARPEDLAETPTSPVASQNLDVLLKKISLGQTSGAEWMTLVAMLSRMSDEQVLAKLLPLLDSPLEGARSLAVKLAASIGSKGMLPLFERGLADSAPYVRACSIMAVAPMGMESPAITDAVRNLIENDSDGYTLKMAAEFFEARPNLIDDNVAAGLCRIISDRSIRAGGEVGWGPIAAGWALCKSAAGGDAVTKALEDAWRAGRNATGDDLAVAVAAAGALAKRGAADNEMKKWLLSNVANPSEMVRASAVMGLQTWVGDDEVKRAIAAQARTDSGIGHFYRAVGDFGAAAKDDELASACSDRLAAAGGNFFARVSLARALTLMGKRQGPETLLEMTQDNMPTGRLGAYGMLRTATGQDIEDRVNAPASDRQTAINQWREYIDANFR